MSFKDQDWSGRFVGMGDEAEAIFMEVAPRGYVKYGLDRPPIQLANVPPMIRYTPDFLQGDKLVEVQGIGRDQKIKLKCDKWGALVSWDQQFPVDLFVWDRTNMRYTQIGIGQFPVGSAEIRLFPEGKPYFEVKADHLEGWVEHAIET